MTALTNQLNILDKSFGKMNAVLIDYLINNFSEPLGFSEVRNVNIQHYIDGLMAHRAYFYSLELWERVDEINYYLDRIAECTHTQSNLSPPHHDEMYRPPVDLSFLEKFKDADYSDEDIDINNLTTEEIKYLNECKEKDAL